MTGPEQHAATVQRLNESVYLALTTKVSAPMVATAIANLDELVALAGQTTGETTLAMCLRQQERAEAAEARADELQRELAWTKGTASRHLDAAYRTAAEKLVEARREADRLDRLSADMSATLVQTQREADQLRAALEQIAELEDKTYYDDPSAGFAAVARAALAGVQTPVYGPDAGISFPDDGWRAGRQGCQCPAGSYDRGNAVHAPYCPQADNEDSAPERPPRDSGKPRSHP